MLPFRGNTDARVSDGKMDKILSVRRQLRSDAHRNRSLRGEFSGAVEKVEQYLSEPRVVAHEPLRRATVDRPFQQDRFFCRQRPDHRGRVVNQRGERKRPALQLKLSGLDLGEIENVIDDGQQRLVRQLDEVEIATLFLVQAPSPRQQILNRAILVNGVRIS